MNAQSFEDLVNQCLRDDAKHRFLYVFVRVAQMDAQTRAAHGIEDEDAAIVQILFDAHQPAEPGLTFDQVREHADKQNPDWTLCVVGVDQCGDYDARAAIGAMREKVLAGDIDDYLVLDRDARAVLADSDDETDDDPEGGATVH